MLEELVEDDLRRRVALQLDDDSHALAVRLVVHARDSGDALLRIRLGDRLENSALVNLIRDLGNDDLVLAALFDDLGLAANRDRAAPRPVGFANRLVPEDRAAGRKIRPVHDVAEVVVGDFGIVDQRDDRVGDLAEIVRRNVRRHADCDAARAVDEQLRQPSRKNARLDALIIEVRDERNGLFIDVGENVERRSRETRLGIPVGRRRVGIDRAEVAVAVDQRIAQREILRHANERVVDRAIAVRMVALEHLADDTGALAVLLGGFEAHLAHRVEDAPLNGLEAVAHVGQRPRGDDRHRIREIALPHLIFDVDLRYDIVVQ